MVTFDGDISLKKFFVATFHSRLPFNFLNLKVVWKKLENRNIQVQTRMRKERIEFDEGEYEDEQKITKHV